MVKLKANRVEIMLVNGESKIYSGDIDIIDDVDTLELFFDKHGRTGFETELIHHNNVVLFKDKITGYKIILDEEKNLK